MLQYLSDEWLDRAAALLEATPSLAPEDPFAIEMEISTDEGFVRYAVAVVDGRPGLHRDTPPGCSVGRFSMAYPTAAAIAEGRQSAQAAFMAGTLHVGGDISAIIANADRLVDLNDTLALLRAETSF